MKFVYTPDKDNEIVRHEKTMLEKYLNIIKKFNPIFEQYDYSLKVGCRWTNFLKKDYSAHRLPLKMDMSVIFIVKYRKMVKKYI